MSNLYTTLSRAALLGSVASVVLAVSPVTQAVAQDADESLEEVVVTGSRIVRKDLQAASPVTVVNQEEVSFTGNTRMEDLVQSLPQAFTAQNSTIANGSSGTATVNLRGLGSSRTLVLINGRRLQPGDPMSPAVDLNFIPSSLVKRVEVLTGGASSVYGADAVAGVVNFIMDTDFEGLKTHAQYSFYQHNNNNKAMQAINEAKGFDVPTGSITDGGTWDVGAALGANFDDGKGHASAYVNYRNIGQITKANRDYTNCTVNAGKDGPGCGGSTTTPWGTFINQAGTYINDPVTGEFRPYDGEAYNYGPLNHIQRPDEKWSGGVFINYEVSDNLEAYIETMFMDDFTTAQIAPSGNFYRSTTINCDNPMMTAEQKAIICEGYADDEIAPLRIGRRNVEGGNRQNDMRHTSFRVMGGLKGQIDDTWSYDVYGMHATTIFSEQYLNDLNTDRLKDALDVILDGDGIARCRSEVNADGEYVPVSGCAPWNVFQAGAVTQEALDYISTVAVAKGQAETQMVSGTITGEVAGLSPMASSTIGLAFGAEYRRESMVYDPDEVYAKGLRAGSGGSSPPVEGGFNVKELFAEALIPLVQGKEFVQDLTLELGYRYSDYNLSGGEHTFKVAGTWVPNDQFKVRAGFNRAVRAPNAVELYNPQTKGLGGRYDPCATATPDFSEAQCANTGVTAAQYGNVLKNPANQYNTLNGGNPNLSPEVADTFTVGLVIQPDAIPGFSATIDYFDIKIENTIGALGADDIVKTCAQTGDAQLCSLVHRDELGSLWLDNTAFTETTLQNIGNMGSEGIDFTANYRTDIGDMGALRFNMVGTYLLAWTYSDPLTSYDCQGYYGNQCGQPRSSWRHKARATWETNFDTEVSVAWRMIGAAKIDESSSNPALANPNAMTKWINNNIDKMGNYHFFDLAVSYALNEGTKFTVGVNNVFDKEPNPAPSLSSTGFSGTYDPLGRYIFAGVKANF